MATTFTFTVSCDSERAEAASRVLRLAHAQVATLEAQLSEFRSDSCIWRLNHAAIGERVELSQEAIELLERCDRLTQITSGAFDCAAKSSSRPQGMPPVSWCADSRQAWRNGPHVHVGFGAIGKGYALDRVRLLLEQEGFKDYLLNAGGSSIVISGFAGPGTPWTWAWSWEKDQDGDSVGIPFSHSNGQTIAIGVSGTHEKGQHLIDPRSPEMPSSSALSPRSALIAAPSAADADALSTALFVSGFEETHSALSPLPISPAMAEIDSRGIPRWNGIFKQLWGAPAAVAGALSLAMVSNVWAEEPAAATVTEEDSAINLEEIGGNSFNPYVFERNPYWVLLPIFALLLVLAHLKKIRRIPMKRQSLSLMLTTTAVWTLLESFSGPAFAVDLVPMGKALVGVLGTPKAFKKTIGDSTFFYSKDAKGKADKVAFIEKNVWQNTCSHTWIVGVGADGKITQVVAQEQQCPHAKPAAAASYLEQYIGAGPADVSKLKGKVSTIAKATGSCELATEAVVHAVTAFQKIKGQI